MPKKNTSKFALLGILNWEPMSGYSMKKYIDQGIQFFWNMSFGTIYPMLKKMESEGLATKSINHQSGKPDRIIYSITSKGKNELYSWQLESTELAQLYDELLLKLFVGQNLTDDEKIDIIKKYKKKMEERYRIYGELELDLKESSKNSNQDFMFYLTLRNGVLTAEAKLRWCDESINEINFLKQNQINKREIK